MAVFAYEPESFTMSLSWVSDVMKSNNGLEHRSCSQRYPRFSFDVDYVLTNEQLQELRLLLFTDVNTTHYMPLWPEQTVITGSTSTSTVKIPVTNIDWALANTRVIIYENNSFENYVDRGVVSVTTSAGEWIFSLDSAVNVEFRTAGAIMIPLMPVRLEDGAATGRWRLNDLGRASIKCVSTSTWTVAGTSASLTFLGSRGYLDYAPTIEDNGLVQEQIDGETQVMDGGGLYGNISYYAQTDILRQAKFAWSTDSDRQYWKKLLWALHGRRGVFLYPTWRPDLVLNTQPLAGATSIIVEESPDFRDWFAFTSHKYIALMLANGEFEPLRVATITDLGSTLSLNIDQGTVSGNTVEYISLLELVRLGTDTFSVEYAHGIGRFSLPLVVVQQ